MTARGKLNIQVLGGAVQGIDPPAGLGGCACASDGARVLRGSLLKASLAIACALAALVLSCAVGADEAYADAYMERLYNPYTSEHLYTADASEVSVLTSKHGWKDEGIAWKAPSSGTPVYRLYNPGLGDHHYTMDANERDVLASRYGWKYEGVAWYSAPASSGKPLYRLYNPGLKTGSHHYTLDASERDVLAAKHGWKYEGVAWYGLPDHTHTWADHVATRQVQKRVAIPYTRCTWCGAEFYADASQEQIAAHLHEHGERGENAGTAGVVRYETRTVTESYVDYRYCTGCGKRY